MKRLLSCLLCASLLLSCCGCSLLQSLTGTVNNDPASDNAWHKPTVPGGTSTDAPETPTEASTEPIPPETTASGATIITDYSNYSPRADLPEANYTRLSPDPIPDLKAGNYGQIYPFAAEALYSSEEDGYSWLQGYYYGFVTAEGKIICDPTYIDVNTVFYYNYEVNAAQKMPLWTFSRTANVHEETYEDSSWLAGDEIYGVCAMDGSWVLPCQFVGVEGTEEGFIGTRSWNEVDFDVYDMDGNRRFGSKEIAEQITLGEYCTISYSDGVYTLYTNDKWYAVDNSGKLFLGPLYSLGSFSGGLAPASENGMYYGYVDKSGSWALQPFYDGAGSFQGDYAVVTTGRGPAVIDRSGNYTLMTDGDGYLSLVGDGYVTFSPYDGNERLYDAATGELLLDADEQEYFYPLHDSLFYSYIYDSDNDESSVRIFNLDSGAQVTIKGATYVLDPRMAEFSYSRDSTLYYEGEPCIAVHLWRYDESLPYGGASSYVLLDDELNQIEKLEDTDLGSYTDLVTGQNYLYIGPSGSGVYRYYRPDGSLLGRYRDNIHLQFLNGYTQVTDERCARLLDPNGRELFCYPLLGALND